MKTPPMDGTGPTRAIDLRTHLQEELLKRCEKNPRYSLRAFAQSLEIHPATLSHILRGRRKLSRDLIRQLRGKLELPPEAWTRLLEKEFTSADEVGPDFHQLSLDSFHVIADWYHYAILELARLPDFEFTASSIARSLGITPSEANLALERLERLALLQRDEKGRYRAENNSNLQKNDLTSAALRKLQKQVLTKAIEALENIPLGERDQSSLTFVMPSEKMPEAIEELKKFRRSFSAKFQTGGRPDRVYQLSLSLYPLSRVIESKKGKKS